MHKFCTNCGTPLEDGHCPTCEPQHFNQKDTEPHDQGQTKAGSTPGSPPSSATPPSSAHERETRSTIKGTKRSKTTIYIIGAIAVAVIVFFIAGGWTFLSKLINGEEKEKAEAVVKNTNDGETVSIRPSESKLPEPLTVKAVWNRSKDTNTSEIQATLKNEDKESLRINLNNFSSIDSAGSEDSIKSKDKRDEIILNPGKEAKLIFPTMEVGENSALPKTLVYDEPNGIRLEWNMDNLKDYQNDWLKGSLEDFIAKYSVAAVEAINQRDFSIVSDMIDYEDKRYEEVRTYIDHLEEKGIYEDHLSTKIENIKEVDSNTWEVTLIESFTIYKEGEANDRTFRSTCIVKQINGEYKMGTLTETKEI